MVSNEISNRDNDSRKILAMIVMIATLMVCTTSATYAYFAIAPVSNNSITGTAATASLSLNVERIAPTATKWNGSTQSMVPQLGTALGTAMGDMYSCVDGNNNVVCQVYEVTLTNGSTAQISVSGTITFTGASNMANLKWRLYKSAATELTSAQAASNLASVTDAAVTNNLAVAMDTNLGLTKSGTSGSVQHYYIVVWIDEINEAQDDTGTYIATIDFNAVNNQGQSIGGITSTITN